MHALRCEKPKSVSRGFTLIEVLVVVGILAMMGSGIFAFQKGIISNSKILQSSLLAQQQIRKTLQSFVSELRSASPSEAGTYTIESIATSSIVFYSDVDGGGDVERVRYFFSTSSSNGVHNVLKKGVIKPTGTFYNGAQEVLTTIVRDVKNSSTTPIFTYYDATYNGVASSTAPLPWPVLISSVRLVKMNIAVDPNVGRSPVYQTYTTQVSIRNLKDNL